MEKGTSFNTLFISSWKYASACAYPKGTSRYSYFLNGDVKALLGIESFQGICDGTQHGDQVLKST